jgi:molybdopterin/thiamine biosynthesis adenylyltransferase
LLGPRILGTTNIDKDRAERQKRIAGWNQSIVERSHVIVAGAGALGNELVKNLALLGIGRISLIDFDYVVGSNLNRCIFFRKSDASHHLSKAEIVSRRARQVNPEVEVVPMVEDLENIDRTIYKTASLAFGGLDSLVARMQLNIDCYYNSVPLVDGAIEGFEGQVQVVVPPSTACLECGISDRDRELVWSRISCTGQAMVAGERKLPALPTTASLISAIQIQEGLKLLFGIDQYRKEGKWNDFFGEPILGKRLYYSGVSNVFRVYEVSRSEHCNVCSERRERRLGR